MILMIFLIFLLVSASMCAAFALGTSRDGSFQAIAQSPETIDIYWKTEAPAPVIVRDGVAYAELITRIDPVTGYSVATIADLQPNSAHTFSLGPDGAPISEKTWSKMPESADFDVLVIGANASGVAAAVTAARLGQSVALVEETNRVGGMAANGLGNTDIRNISRSNGFFEDFRRRVVEFYGKGNGLTYEPRVANAVIKQMLYEQDTISLFLKCCWVEPIMQGRTVQGAVVREIESGRSGRINAKVTIDATDVGDFAAACGAKFTVGREVRSPQEPHAGFIYFNDATQEILPGSTGEADGKQQSYAYLLICKDYGEDGAPLIERPRSYDPETYRNSPPWKQTWAAMYGRLPNGKFELNQHPFGTDWPGINYDYPTASPERRREIEAMYKDRALGYLYYLQNELGQKNIGLADDEFIDNCNFPDALYVREARRFIGSHIFNESDAACARQSIRPDSIAIGDYPMDSHAVEDLKDPTAVHKGEGEMWLSKFTPWYQIPYGVLVPQCIDGLLISTAVSATHVGYGTLRMEPVRMSLGQAAGAAAYWSILFAKQPREVNPGWIQDKILSQYAYINWYADVHRETRHFKAIQFMAARGFFPAEDFQPDADLTVNEAYAVLDLMLCLENYPCGLERNVIAESDAAITRAEFAQLLVSAKQKTSQWWENVSPECPSYSDVPVTSPYYSAIETLRTHRVTSSLFDDYEQGLFKPESPITRADAIEAIYLAHRVIAMNCWRE